MLLIRFFEFEPTLYSMNSLFSNFFGEFLEGILGGVRDYLGEDWGGFQWKKTGNVRNTSGKL